MFRSAHRMSADEVFFHTLFDDGFVDAVFYTAHIGQWQAGFGRSVFSSLEDIPY